MYVRSEDAQWLVGREPLATPGVSSWEPGLESCRLPTKMLAGARGPRGDPSAEPSVAPGSTLAQDIHVRRGRSRGDPSPRLEAASADLQVRDELPSCQGMATMP